jgi:hypothetical protein
VTLTVLLLSKLVAVDLDETFVADAEVVGHLVQDDASDLAAQARGIGTPETLERTPVDRDLVGSHPGIATTAPGQREPFVEPQRYLGRLRR